MDKTKLAADKTFLEAHLRDIWMLFKELEKRIEKLETIVKDREGDGK